MGQLSYTTQNVDYKLTNVYGEIYSHDNSTAQSIANGATYTKIINFTGNGYYENCTPDYANNKITLSLPGRYKIDSSFSFGAGTNNIDIFVALFLDGVEVSDIHFQRTIGIINTYGSSSVSGIIEVTDTPVDIDVRVRHDNLTPVNLTFTYMNLNVLRIGV